MLYGGHPIIWNYCYQAFFFKLFIWLHQILVAAHGFSCPAACAVFLDQDGSHVPCVARLILSPLDHQGNPCSQALISNLPRILGPIPGPEWSQGILPSNPFTWVSPNHGASSHESPLNALLNTWGATPCRSPASLPGQQCVLRTLASLGSLDFQTCLSNLESLLVTPWSPSLYGVLETLKASSGATVELTLSISCLRNHSPSLSDVHCLENHFSCILSRFWLFHWGRKLR